MNLNKKIKSKDEARNFAIAWQGQFNELNLSYEELLFTTDYFYRLAKKFGLVREFKENGII